MNAWWADMWLKRSTVPDCGGRLASALLLPLLLSGCADRIHERIAPQHVEVVTPKERVTDFRLAQCETLWLMEDSDAVNNALYWLRAMDCAGRLTPIQTREAAQRLTGDTWDQAFMQSILLDQLRLTPNERRQTLDRLNRFQQDFPAALRPLIQSWRDRQTFWLALTDERLRYQRQQETNDKQLQMMRQQQSYLQEQLDVTTRKLENLTDIERQLSARKQSSSELPDSQHDVGVGDQRSPSTKNTEVQTRKEEPKLP